MFNPHMKYNHDREPKVMMPAISPVVGLRERPDYRGTKPVYVAPECGHGTEPLATSSEVAPLKSAQNRGQSGTTDLNL